MRGICIVRGHDANRLRSMKVHDYICPDHTSIPDETTLPEIIKQLLHNPFPHFPVNDKQDDLTGVLTLRDVRALLAQPGESDSTITAADLMIREYSQLHCLLFERIDSTSLPIPYFSVN